MSNVDHETIVHSGSIASLWFCKQLFSIDRDIWTIHFSFGWLCEQEKTAATVAAKHDDDMRI